MILLHCVVTKLPLCFPEPLAAHCLIYVLRLSILIKPV